MFWILWWSPKTQHMNKFCSGTRSLTQKPLPQLLAIHFDIYGVTRWVHVYWLQNTASWSNDSVCFTSSFLNCKWTIRRCIGVQRDRRLWILLSDMERKVRLGSMVVLVARSIWYLYGRNSSVVVGPDRNTVQFWGLPWWTDELLPDWTCQSHRNRWKTSMKFFIVAALDCNWGVAVRKAEIFWFEIANTVVFKGWFDCAMSWYEVGWLRTRGFLKCRSKAKE